MRERHNGPKNNSQVKRRFGPHNSRPEEAEVY